MKQKLLLLVSAILLTALSYGQAVDSLGCTGALGDVKYSVLSLTEFQGENGNCWVLMDGRDVTGNNIAAYIAGDTIPDARGYFIRCFDTRTSNRIDVDRDVNDEVGSAQMDEFKSHHHDFSHPLLRKTGDSSNNTNGADGDGSSLNKTQNEGGSETRPKNITLYTYIRID